MLKLILKDILIQKKNFFFVVILYPLFAILVFQSIPESIYSVAMLSAAYILIAGSFSYDERMKADLFLNSLPVRKNELVAAKYVSMILFAALGGAVTVIYSTIIKALSLSIDTGTVSASKLLFVLVMVILMNCIQMPFLFKYGYTKTRIINTLIYVGLISFFSAISKIISEESVNILNFINSTPDILLYIMLISFTILSLTVSQEISLKIYKAKDF